jgi:exodeoxyribonuclease V alpha subunit
MTDVYERIVATGILNPLETSFADLAVELDPDCDHLVQIAAALAVRACRMGNVCLDLQDIKSSAYLPDEVALPGVDQFLSSLQDSRLVGSPGEFKPFILDTEKRLYLQRYWDYEQRLAGCFLRLAAGHLEIPDKGRAVALLDRFFPYSKSGADWQKIGAATALLKQLVIISGGPGTGKTTTVVKIIALLQELATPDSLRIGLAAPTGKAVVRLADSVKSVKMSLPLSSSVQDAIPDHAVTIHRLLGAVNHSPYFRHNPDNPLPLDVLIVDEASMVDLALMCKLVEALPEQCRLILLGDKDQLASVEAGRVIGDICAAAHNGFFENFAGRLAEMGIHLAESDRGIYSRPLQDNIVLLENNYRFEAASGIGCFCKAIEQGCADTALACLDNDALPDVRLENYSDGWWKRIAADIIKGFKGMFMAEDPAAALTSYNSFRILCVHRHGPLGVREMNGQVEDVLRNEGLLNDKEWYHGRPVMISRNDYGLGLFNGDTGIAIEDEDGRIRVCFSGPDGIRYVSSARLQNYETAYCMTVHKSQGSEFDRVMLLLPEENSTLLTRELIYTAVSRAKRDISLWGSKDVLKKAITARISRSSGLREMMRNE